MFILQDPEAVGIFKFQFGGMKSEFAIAETVVLAVLKDIAAKLRLIVCSRLQGSGGRKNKFIIVFPTKFTGDGGFEADVFRRVPMVDQGVGDEGFVETEYEVSQRFHFIFGVGVFETYEIAVTGKNKHADD